VATKETPVSELTIKLTEEEIRTGLHFAGEAHMAQARLQALNEAENSYIRRLAQKYELDPNTYHLRDWLTGFEPITKQGG
jgi:hypothetical protein